MDELNKTVNPAAPPDRKSDDGPKYSDREIEYIKHLRGRFQAAQELKNTPRDEWDGMNYNQKYDDNLKRSFSYIKPRTNPEDTTIVTGSARQALLSLVARIAAYNFQPDVMAYDKNDNELKKVGRALTDTVAYVNREDRDQEKQLFRFYEMYSQGEVFYEKNWVQEFRIDKQWTSKFDGNIDSATWKERLKKVYEGIRGNVVCGKQVYLGSYSVYEMERQPYMFTVEVIPYAEAKDIYGKWERWKFVSKKIVKRAEDTENGEFFNDWTLTDIEDEMVEVIKYQDLPNDEFAICLNGTHMTPVGMPKPWKMPGYSVCKGVSGLIRPNWPFGKSILQQIKTSSALEDEFWRLAVLKTQDSFRPTMLNNSGVLLSRKNMLPGKVLNGIRAGSVAPLIEGAKGVTQSEMAMMDRVRQNINEQTLPEIKQGQSPQGSQTATEIIQVQKEAELTLSLAVLSAIFLEERVQEKTLELVMENWLEPVGTMADETKTKIVNKFRHATNISPIEGEGQGRKLIEITDDELPQGEERKRAERALRTEEDAVSKREGRPFRKVTLNRKQLKEAINSFRVEIVPKPKETSALDKLQFTQMFNQAAAMFGQELKLDFWEEKFAEIWNIPTDRAFTRSMNNVMGGQMNGQQVGQPDAGMAVPRVAGVNAQPNLSQMAGEAV